jgi:hypothetical protein
MTPKLTEELREALRQSGGAVEVQDDQSNKVHVISESDVFHRAMQALQTQEDHAAIQSGIEALESGNVLTLDELDHRIRSRLGSM